MKEIDNDGALSYWLKTAKPGEKVIYYTGFLMRDREVFLRSGGFADRFPPTIKAAVLAWRAYLNGGVRLIQKKVGQNDYQYIAVKS